MILEMLKKRAQSSEVCVVDVEGREMTFQDLDHQSDALAHFLWRHCPAEERS